MVSSPRAFSTRRSTANKSTPTATGRVTAPSLRDWTDAERRQFRTGVWTQDERLLFRAAMEAFPDGPWSAVATFVGTRTVRQTMTHAQKQQLRKERHARGLKPSGRKPRSQSDSSDISSSSDSSNNTDTGGSDGDHNTTAQPTPSPSFESQRDQDDDASTDMVVDYEEEIGALLDALTFDWVAVDLASPAWLEFETWPDFGESAP